MTNEITKAVNMVELKNGQIIFGHWKNKDQTKAYYKSLQDSDIVAIKDSDSKNKAIMKATQDWLLAYSIFNGSGYLKDENVIKTHANIQNMDIVEATKLGQAFNDYATDMVEDIKKK